MIRNLQLLAFFSILFLVSCSKEDNTKKDNIPTVYKDGEVSNSLKMNQLQYLSSHNSYRKRTDKDIYSFVKELMETIPLPFDLEDWEYDHIDIYSQMQKYGIRHVELDIYGDKNGGRFYNRLGYKFVDKDTASHIDALKEPGLKVIHIPDLDFNTNYYTFIDALKDIKRWSNDYPDHLPIYVMIETKTETVGDAVSFLSFVKSEPWDEENIAAIENEILQVFTRDQIIAPDDIRKGQATLREAVLQDGWLTIGEARGKIMFMFDGEDFSKIYKGDQLSLEGKLIFTNANENDADAAFVKVNDPFDPRIPALVKQGFLVRSMIGGVKEAKSGSYAKWEAGKAAGVQFLSTDYYRPDEKAGVVTGWTDFHVGLENNSYRINPVTK